jgi:hypothetical protein
MADMNTARPERVSAIGSGRYEGMPPGTARKPRVWLAGAGHAVVGSGLGGVRPAFVGQKDQAELS